MKSTPKKGGRKQADRRYGDGRAAFIGHIESIQKWVDEGRTLRSFYDDHDTSLAITYSQFVRHARKLLRGPTGTRSNALATFTSLPARETPTRGSQPIGAGSSGAAAGAPQFRHSAEASEKEDLV